MLTTTRGRFLAAVIGVIVTLLIVVIITPLYDGSVARTSTPPLPTPIAAISDDPAPTVAALVTALDAGDVTRVLATLAPDLPTPLDRAAGLVATWQQAGEEPHADTAAHLGTRLQLDVGAPARQDAIAVSTITARHSAGALVLTVMLRRTSEGWRASDWQLQIRDLRLPTPTAAGLR